MVSFDYTSSGRKKSITVPWRVVGNALVGRKMAESTDGSYVEIEGKRILISDAYRALTAEQKGKICNFVTNGL